MGIASFQAVEAVKLMFIVWLSSYLVRYRDQIGVSLMALLKPLGMAGALVALLLLQPDFGSSALLLAITLCMVWLGGANQKHIIGPGHLHCRGHGRHRLAGTLPRASASPPSWIRGPTSSTPASS